jgi:hypothetical protein
MEGTSFPAFRLCTVDEGTSCGAWLLEHDSMPVRGLLWTSGLVVVQSLVFCTCLLAEIDRLKHNDSTI